MGLFSRITGGTRGTPARVSDVWCPDEPNFDIVGESHYYPAIQGLLPSRLGPSGEEVLVDATLVREPGNSHDRNAVAVHGPRGKMGHLSREDAARFAPTLDALAAQGRVAQTTARVWGGMDRDYRPPRFYGSVRLALPRDPDLMFPANSAPAAPHAVLPVGRSVQVTGEENHQDAVTPWVGRGWVYATLHEIVEKGPRSEKNVIEVAIDGRRVGTLTQKTSADLLPAVRHLAEYGLLTAAAAKVSGSKAAAQVTVHPARTGSLSTYWFARATDGRARVTTMDPVPVHDATQQAARQVSDPAADTATASVDAGRSQPVAAPVPEPVRPPAAWYPDPHGLARLRWWDGDAWTGHTAD